MLDSKVIVNMVRECKERANDAVLRLNQYTDNIHEQSVEGINTSAGGIDDLGAVVSDLSTAIDDLATVVSAMQEGKEQENG